MVLREAEAWRNVRIRAIDRLVAVSGLARALRREALGVGECALAALRASCTCGVARQWGL
eukprot:6149577-Pyramimonas_sp.AAC.1